MRVPTGLACILVSRAFEQEIHMTENRNSEPEIPAGAVEDMLRVNEAQKKYYEEADGAGESKVNGFATNLWRRWRQRALSVFDESEMDRSLSEIHLRWLSDKLPTAKVLDLGVGYGNPLSMTLAHRSREYVAVDLSASMVAHFERQLRNANLPNARAVVADVLSDNFPEYNFDIVYARAVFHHFQHFDAFLSMLSQRMSPGGVVVTLDDPLETWWPMKALRLAYRPFQTDASWEWPFTRRSLSSIERHFKIVEKIGTYGRSKWAIPLGFLAPSLAKRSASKWHKLDLQTNHSMSSIRSCLRASFLLSKP